MCVWNCPIKEMWKPVRNSARKKIFGRMRPKQKKNKHNPSINQWEESNRLYKSIQKEKHERMSLLLPPTRTIPPRPMPPLRTVPPLGRCRYSDVPGWVDAASDDGASSDGTASRTFPAGSMPLRTMAPLRDGTASRTMPAGTMRPRTMAPRVPSPRAGAPVPALLLASRTQRPAVITSDAWHRIETSFDLTLLFSFLSKTGRHNDVTQRLRGLFTYSVPGTTTLLCHGANLNPGPNLPDELTSSAI